MIIPDVTGRTGAMAKLEKMLNSGDLTYDQYLEIINGLAEGGKYNKYEWYDNGNLNSYNLTPEDQKEIGDKAKTGLKGYTDSFLKDNPIVSKFGGDLSKWFQNKIDTEGRTVGSMYQDDKNYKQFADLMGKAGAKIPDLQRFWTKDQVGKTTPFQDYIKKIYGDGGDTNVDLSALQNMDKYTNFLNTNKDIPANTTPATTPTETKKDTTTTTNPANKPEELKLSTSAAPSREPRAFTRVDDILGKFKLRKPIQTFRNETSLTQKEDTLSPEELEWLTKLKGGQR